MFFWGGHAQNIRIAESMFLNCRGLLAKCHPNCRGPHGRVPSFLECAGQPNCRGCFRAADGDDGDDSDDDEEGDGDDDHDDGDGNDDDGDGGGGDGDDDDGDADGEHGAGDDDDGDTDDGDGDDGDEDDDDDGDDDDGDYTIFLLMGGCTPKYNLLKRKSPCASWRPTMVRNFQTLPEIGRAGLKVGTIQKSTNLRKKHGTASKKEAGDPCWSHPNSAYTSLRQEKFRSLHRPHNCRGKILEPQSPAVSKVAW